MGPRSQGGISVEVNTGKRTLIKGAFIATMKSGHEVTGQVAAALTGRPAGVEFLTTAEAAAHARVAAGTIRRWIRERRLVGCRAGRQVRVRREDLDKLLRSGPRSGPNVNQLTPEQLARRDFG